MSNPGVIYLAEKEINGQSFRIEDNIGEAVHIHYGDMRLDMSICEFMDFERNIAELVNWMVGVEGADVRNFDPVYLFLGLRDFVSLERVEIDHVELGKLVTDTMDEDENERFMSIADSRVVKALKGDKAGLMERRQINLYGESNQSRFEKIMSSIKEHGYPYKDEYIILYNDGLYIRDGLHRASCLFHLHGDIKIPILRLYFHDNAYSDKDKEAEFEEKRMFLKEQRVHQYERVDSGQVIKPLYKALMNALLAGKKVAIKGAGEHTEAVLGMLDKSIDLRCIIANDCKITLPRGIGIISDDDIKNQDIDIILISSAKYRGEMAQDIFDATVDLDRDYCILDIYTVMENLGIHIYKGIL